MNSWIKISILSLCICVVIVGNAQEYKLSGVVYDSLTRQNVEGVEIYDAHSGQIVLADEKGQFSFIHLESGEHRLTIFATNYHTTEIAINLVKDTSVVLFVEQLNIELSAVEIAARRQELFALKRLKDVEGLSIYAGKKSEVVLLDLVSGNLATNNSRQIYAQISGLNIYEGSEGGIQLGIGGRGLDPNRTSNFNTRQNGYDISADVLGYPENYYTPPSEAISEIQIIRGASSLQYGTQFGGLINFKLRKIPSFKEVEIRSNQTIGSFGLFNTFNYVGINKGKFSLDTYFNHKRGDGYRENSEYDLNNFFVSLEYKFGKRTSLSGEFTYFDYLAKQAGGLTDQLFEMNPRLSTRTRNWFDVDWKLYNLKLEHALNDRARFSLSYFGLSARRQSLGFRGNPANLNENPITALDEQDNAGHFILPRDLIIGNFKNHGLEFRFLNQYRLKGKKSVALLGVKYYNSDNDSFQGPGSLDSGPDFTDQTAIFKDYPNQSIFEFPNLNAALFGENIFYLSEHLSLTPGFRFEYIKTGSIGNYNQVVFDNAGNAIASTRLDENRELKRSFALFGAGLNYKRSESFNLYLNVSQNYRSVTFSDIRVVSPTFIIDPDIRDEKGFTADIGVRGRVGKFLSYETGIYSLLYNDRIGIILDNRANRVRKNIGKALITGLESLIDFNFARLLHPDRRDIQLNLFLNSAITFSEYISSEENNVKGNEVEFIPKINLKSGINIGYRSFSTSFQITHLSKQFTDAQNSAIALPGDIRSGILGEIPSYTIADLSFNYKWNSFSIRSGINNAFNEAYFTRRATGYPGPGIIPSEGRSFYLTLSIEI